MVAYTFGPWLTIDQYGEPVREAAGSIYAPDDEGLTTPLVATDLAGLPLGQPQSGVTGILQPFLVEDRPVVMWVSGEHRVVVASWRGMQEAAAAAAAAAEAASAVAAATQFAAEEAAAAARAAALAAGSALPPIPVITSAGSYVPSVADAGKLVEFTGSAAATLTVPSAAAAPFPVGASVAVRQYGTGVVTITGAVGVTVRSRGAAYRMAGQYAEALLTKRGTNEWVLTGDVTLA